METCEKIYYCDRDNNDNALAEAILAGNNRKDDWSPIAAMRGEVQARGGRKTTYRAVRYAL